MKTVNFNHTFWLTGYYDDFHSSKAVADDKNFSNVRTVDHAKSHFGSVIGGTNLLNPRFFYSYYDRLRSGDWNDGDFAFDYKEMTYGTTEANKLQMNRGLHEWIAVDLEAGSGDNTEYQSQLFVPSSLMANRHRWNGAGNEGYLRFQNSHDTSGHYYSPTGTIDPTFGGSKTFPPVWNLGFSGAYKNLMGGHARLVGEYAGATLNHTFFTGFYTGERAQVTLNVGDIPETYLHDIKSPSGQNFLVNSFYSDESATGTKRLITYDGALRLRGLGEMFHLRISAHKIGDWTFDNYILKIGYDIANEYSTTGDAHTSTACLAEIPITLANLGIGGLEKWEQGGGNTAYNADQIWADIFVFFDFNAMKWFAYANDATSHFATNSIASGIEKLTAKGWSLDAKWSANGGQNAVVLDTLIDRAAVMLPLNWRVGGVEFPPPVQSFDFTSGADKVSNLTLTVLDDGNEFALSALTTGDSASEWRLLMMNRDESRPLWHGFVEGISHSQDSRGKLLSTSIEARDSAGTLDRILPIWETGQNAFYSLNQHISMDSINTKRNYETTELMNTMMFGQHALTVSQNSLGFNSFNIDSLGAAYTKDPNARTSMFNGQTIQMYMGEDEYGANNIEENWEGKNQTSFGFFDVHGMGEHNATNKFAIWCKYDPDVYGQPAFSGNDQTKVITDFGGIAVGNTITLKGTQGGYDGTYEVKSLKVIRKMIRITGTGNANYFNVNTKDYFCQIETTTDYSSLTIPTGDEIGIVEKVSRGYPQPYTSYSTILTNNGLQQIDMGIGGQYATNKEIPVKAVIEFYGAHNLSVGDWFMMPDGFVGNGTTGTLQALACTPLQVISVEGTDKAHVVLPYDVTGSSVGGIASSFQSQGSRILRMGAYNANPNAGSHRLVKSKPVIYKTLPTTNSILDSVKHRTIHARWMRDLPLSPFFRAQFGVIDAVPYWRTGKGSSLHWMKSPHWMAANGGGFSGRNALSNVTGEEGQVLHWHGLNSVHHALGGSNEIKEGCTTLKFDECGLWYFITKYNMTDDGIILELLDTETNESQYVIGNTITAPSNTGTLSYDDSSDTFTVAGGQTVNKGDIVIHEGFTHYDLNGVFQVDQCQSSTEYTAFRISYEPLINEFSYVKAQYQSGSQWSLGSAHYFNDPDAIKAVRQRVDFTAARNVPYRQQDPASETGGVFRKGFIEIGGIKGIKKTFDPLNTIVTLRKIDESNGYKHLYVLWADMRNDGKANADGGLRSKEFGMILPTTKNYKIDIAIADQFDENGEPDVFTSLKIGEECDIWQFDATQEPFTGNAWSAQNGGSNYFALDDRYANWENKGGAFLIIDTSRFYNLNTAATGGRSGYSSGGLVDFGDYVLATKGFPYLTDAYYKTGIASYQNNASSGVNIANHKNSLYMLNDKTILSEDVALADTTIYVDDNSLFATSGTGVIICQKGSNRSQEDLVYYFSWTGKTISATFGDGLTGVFITSIDPTLITDINTVNTLLASEKAGLVATGITPASRADIVRKTETNDAGVFEKVLVFNTPSALFPLRLSVNISGIIQSKNTGTYYAHDKLRSMFTLACGDTWATNTALPCVYHMPSLRQAPVEIDSAQFDSFGSSFDAKNTTILSMAKEIVAKDGNGANLQTTLSWFMDRDNILTIRQNIPTGLHLNRDNMLDSQMSSRLGSQITNVRVYYNGNSSFADFPEPVVGSPTRWRILQHPKVFSRQEALSLAKQEFLREKNAQVSIDVDILLQGTQKSKMLDGGRYGYVQDPFIRKYLYDRKANASWSNTWGGFTFNGVQDMRLSNNTRFRHTNNPSDIVQQTQNATGSQGSAVVADISVYDVYANNINPRSCTLVNGSGVLRLGLSNALFDATGDGTYGGASALASNQWTLRQESGIKLSLKTGSVVMPSSIKNVPLNYIPSLPRNKTIPSYGTKSLSSCLKVMYVDKDMPYVSETTGNELRLAISIDGGKTSSTSGETTIPPNNDTTFRLHLIDPVFNTTASAPLPPSYANISGTASTTAQIKGNGLYRVQVPPQYSSAAKFITFSVDYDYLMSILRRMVDEIDPISGTGYEVMANAHSVVGYTPPSPHPQNIFSAFPLGYTLDGLGVDGSTAGLHSEHWYRSLYYAPRIQIVDDLIFQPATTLTLTDTHIDLTNETLYINGIKWSKTKQDIDSVTLNLERTAKHFKYGFTSLFKTIAEGGGRPNRPPRPELPPPTTPPTKPIPPLGGGGSVVPVGGLLSVSKGGDSDNVGFAGISTNLLGTAAFRGLKGRANFATDTGLGDGRFGVIGQNRPSTALSSDRDIDGIESSIASSEGTNVMTSDGFILAGVINPETGAQGETHSNTINVRVPNDISSGGFVSVVAQYTFEGDSSSQAVVSTTIQCAETGASHTQETRLQGQPTGRRSVTLVNPVALNGAEVAGNTVTVTISRSPAQGQDNAGFVSVVIHSVSVKMRRYSNSGTAQSTNFRPY